MQTDAIRKVSIQAETRGVPETTSQLKQLADAQGRIVSISETQTRATAKLEEAQRRQALQLEINHRQTTMLVAANDNLSRSYDAANDNAQQAGANFHLVSIESLQLSNHLKTAAAAAYVASPAFRQLANPVIATTLRAIGPAAVAAGGLVVSALSPALAFISRLAAPIFLAVEAFKALNAITELGEERLKTVAELQEKAFKASGNLRPERKEVISTEEVAQANELNDRMRAATKLIEERWLPLKRDLVGIGVQYNETWVELKELIADAVGVLQKFYDVAKNAGDSLSKTINDSVKRFLPTPNEADARAAGLTLVPSTTPIDQAREALRKYMSDQRLVQQQTLQTTDAGRLFRKELEEQKKKIDDVGKSAGEFDRLANSINRTSAAQEADAQTVGKSVGEHARLRAEMRLREAAAQDGITIDGKAAAKIKEVADRAGEAAQALERARIKSNIQFDRDTLFLSPQDRQIAQQLRGLYGDVTTSLNSAEAAQLRFLNTMKDVKDLTGDFIKSFVSGLMQGKSVMEALGQAALSLAQKLANSAIDDLLSGNFVSAGIKGAAAAAAYFFGKGQADRAKREEEQRRREEESKQRIDALKQRQALAGLDTSTLGGALTDFELRANIERQQAGSQGLLQVDHKTGKVTNPELILLEATLAIERAAIVKKFADDAVAAEKRRADDIKQIRADLADREFAAANDNSTMQGRLLEFDRATIREREKLEKDFAETVPDFDRTRLAERAAIEKQFSDAARQRQQGLNDQLFALGQDQATLAGQLAVFDLQALRQRQDEIKNGGEALVELQALQEQQRLNVIKDFNQKSIDEQKRAAEEAANFFAQLRRNIREFIDGLRAGASSPLSPSARLAAAQTQYNAQLALAQGGNRDALSGITRYASDLLDAAKGFFGSSTGFQGIFNQVTSQLEALPDIAELVNPIVEAIQETTDAVAAQTQVTQLIKQANDASLVQVTATRNLVDAGNSLQTSANALNTNAVNIAADQRNILAAIQGLQSTANSSLATANAQYTEFLPRLRAIAFNTKLNVTQAWNDQGFYTGQARTQQWGVDTLAGGGWVHGPGTGTSDSVFAGNAWVSNGEFVVNAADAARNAATLEAINSGDFRGANDNGSVRELRAMRAELRALREEVARLTRATVLGAEHVREPLDEILGSMTEQVREQKLASQAA